MNSTLILGIFILFFCICGIIVQITKIIKIYKECNEALRNLNKSLYNIEDVFSDEEKEYLKNSSSIKE